DACRQQKQQQQASSLLLSDDRLHACLCALVDILRWPGRAWLSGEFGGGGGGSPASAVGGVSAASAAAVTEIDGQPVGQQVGQQFLTCAHQFPHWSPDLELSHAAFSVLRRWLLCLLECGSPASVARTGLAVKSDLHSLCWQLLDQCERKPAAQADADSVMPALLNETAELACLLCRLDSGLLARYFTRMEGLYAQLLGPAPPPAQSATLHVTLARFLLTHHASVGKDAPQFLAPLYTVCIDRLINSQEFCLELLRFTADNAEPLCWEHGITVRHFPSFIKLLARWPSTFADMFADKILPACLSPACSLEMLHCLIDLPCLSALYELNRLESLGPDFIAQLPANIQPYALFLTHEVYSSAANDDVGGGGDCGDCLSRMLPALAERSLLVFGGHRHADAVARRLALLARRLIDRRPRALLDQLDECLDFAAAQWKRAIGRALPMYLTLLWGFGEACSRRRADNDELDGADSGEVAGESEAQRIARLYECLELLAYEILAAKLGWSALPPRLWCCLATSLAKVACSVQDNMHRCLLVLTKIRTYAESCPPSPDCGYAEIQCLLTRLGELLALLRQPTVGPHVLQPDWSTALEGLRAHENPQSVARVTQLVTRLGLEL
uniref:Non-specific serine/threonine protein kinase n=1 Tax=Macrostomum lignano TaxID=282301 RepID=A0A1I8HHV6_9PLAT